jgi:hypothetical protein
MTPAKLPLALALAAALVLLPGCFLRRSTINERVNTDAVAQLLPGATTAADAVEALGAPTQIVELGFRSAYRYDYTVDKTAGLWLIVVFLANQETRSDRIWLFFDEENVLTHVGTTLDSDSAGYAMPWAED